MRERDKLEALTDGVFAWMNDREISTQQSFEEGARGGILSWLDANRDDIIAAIAERVAETIAAEARVPQP